MSGFAPIRDQEPPLRILTTFLRDGKIPHALLFAGTKGVGKRTTAFRFAMACNCRETAPDVVRDDATPGPCGECRDCRKIESGNHPDILHVKPAGSLIRIAQIRELCRILAMRPYEARVRVAVISEAETMNPEAGNALLKMLEEPPDQTVLILITEQPSDLLPTIVSRCQQIRFRPIPRRQLETMLVESLGCDPAEAEIIARMANGSFADAVEMSRSAWLVKRNWIVRELECMAGRPVAHLLAFAEKLTGDKETLQRSLDVMMSWYRDLAVHRHRPERMIHADLADRIGNSAAGVTPEAVSEKLNAVQRAQKDIAANANIRLTTEALILRLAQPEPGETGGGQALGTG